MVRMKEGGEARDGPGGMGEEEEEEEEEEEVSSYRHRRRTSYPM